MYSFQSPLTRRYVFILECHAFACFTIWYWYPIVWKIFEKPSLYAFKFAYYNIVSDKLKILPFFQFLTCKYSPLPGWLRKAAPFRGWLAKRKSSSLRCGIFFCQALRNPRQRTVRQVRNRKTGSTEPIMSNKLKKWRYEQRDNKQSPQRTAGCQSENENVGLSGDRKSVV